MINYKKLEETRARWLSQNWEYEMIEWDKFDYLLLSNVLYKKKTGKGRAGTYNDVIIMADTETSKSFDQWQYDEGLVLSPRPNHVVAWTISIRFFHMNIVTLYGTRPSEMVTAINNMRAVLQGDDIYIYFHNMAYDWAFLRRFFIKEWGFPKKQLNTKPHYPITIKFENNLIFKDSLILAGRKLEKWAKDLNVEHQKAVGSWDYDLYRDQGGSFTKEELKYIENDTLAGVECLDATMENLRKTIYSIPYTATGIPREAVRKLAKANRGHDRFLAQALDWRQYIKMLSVYHGGYSHANRYYIDELLDLEQTECFDFASSYPFCMLAYKYPSNKFTKFKDCDPQFIIDNSEDYAFIFKLSLINVRLKDPLEPMPAMQESKCHQTLNAQIDNGRITQAGYLNIYICEQDLLVIDSMYTWDRAQCSEVELSKKDYLPRWFTDYVFDRFKDKTMLKGGDPVSYALAKSIVNSLYGMTCQQSVREEYIEVTEPGYYPINKHGDTLYFNSGEYRQDFEKDLEHEYEKYLNRKTSVLNYQIGVWVTAYAFRDLFELGNCVKRYYKEDGKLAFPPHWYYSDTDSCYSDDWDYKKIWDYNEKCKKMLKANGYGPVVRNGKEYWLGVAEHKEPDDSYIEFKVLGSKRYAGRCKEDNKIHITVAGVPKKGAECLNDDLNNFTDKCIFDGKTTGKLTHFYMFNEIYIDDRGNEIGDSIDLEPCDYLMDSVDKWEFIEEEEIILSYDSEDEGEHYEREF